MQAQPSNVSGMDVLVREGHPLDLAFISDTWLKNFGGSAFAKGVKAEAYFPGQRRRMVRLLQRARVLVAADPEEPASIWAYLVFEPLPEKCLIHWGYTKSPFRGMGFFRRLVCEAWDGQRRTEYTHRTDDAKRIAAAIGALYNPYLLEE